MSEEHVSYTGRLARRGDPVTSRAAASDMDGSARQHSLKERALAALQQRDGMTAGEIADYLGLRHDQVWRRISELKNDGKIVAGGARVWAGTGKAQEVWWLANEPGAVQERLL